MRNKKHFDGSGKLLSNLVQQGEPTPIRAPVVNNIDSNYQKDKYYFFEYELDNPDRELSSTLREIFIKHASSFILFSPAIFLVTNIKNVKKFIEDIAQRSNELHIINFSVIAVEKGYIISNWLKRV